MGVGCNVDAILGMMYVDGQGDGHGSCGSVATVISARIVWYSIVTWQFECPCIILYILYIYIYLLCINYYTYIILFLIILFIYHAFDWSGRCHGNVSCFSEQTCSKGQLVRRSEHRGLHQSQN